jgi:hypothetical protein
MLAFASMAALAAGIVPVTVARAATTRVVGVITGVEMHSPVTLQVSSNGAQPATIHTDDKTAYMKWVTHKPWQGNDHVTTAALMQGRCVEVEMRTEADVAKVVRVSDEPAGSVFDPCRSHRASR